MGGMEQLRKFFALCVRAGPWLGRVAGFLGRWLARRGLGFLGLCLLFAGVVMLAAVNWTTWPSRFARWWMFWTETTDDVRNGALVVGGLLAATAGLFLASIRTLAAHRQARVAELRHVSERFTQAVEQLGHKQMPVRLGGIYALEQIARDSPDEYHWPIMESLTAFVRQAVLGKMEKPAKAEDQELTPLQREDPPNADDGEAGRGERAGQESAAEPPPVAADMAAALAVLARRQAENDPVGRYLDLKGAHLVGLSLSNIERVNLAHADLREADLREADLRWANLSWANLRRADLRWADLRRANLRGANLITTNLTEANLVGANLRWANLSRADLTEAILGEADLRETDLRGANLSWADLIEANLVGADLRLANLSRANLSRADLGGAHIKAKLLVLANNPLEATLDDDLRTRLKALLAEAEGKTDEGAGGE